MIDVKEIYEQVTRRSLAPKFGCRLAEAHSRPRSTTQMADGGYMPRETYTAGDIRDVPAMLGQPIDLNSPLKHVMVPNFSSTPPKKLKNYVLRPGCFAPFSLGKGISAQVKYSEGVTLHNGGVASIYLDTDTDEYLESVLGLWYRLKDRNGKPGEGGGKEDANSGMQNQDVGDAVDDAAATKTIKALSETGLSDEVARMIAYGTLDAVTGKLYWRPTLLDLARMLEENADVPTEFVLRVDQHDDNPPLPAGTPLANFLAESYYSAKDGKDVFADIRDSRHKDARDGKTKPFPISKEPRWKQIVKKVKAVTRPWQPGDTGYVSDERIVTVGETGRIVMKGKTAFDVVNDDEKEAGFRKSCIVTADGFRLVYLDPNKPPITVFFMTPGHLIQVLKDIKPQPPTVPVELIRSVFENITYILEQAADTFAKTGGESRRYIP